MSTPSLAHASPLWEAGTSAAFLGRSRTWPIDDSTTKSPPRKREIVRALAGDSTITSGLAIGKRGLAGPGANVKQWPPGKAAIGRLGRGDGACDRVRVHGVCAALGAAR